jgi:hypothetical protein
VAHEVLLPVSLEFRTATITWQTARARVLGWSAQPTGPTESLHLNAEFADLPTRGHFAFPLDRLPDEQRKRCLTARGKRKSNETVKDICSRLEFLFFVHDHRTYVHDSDLRKHSRPADAWELRDEFLRLSMDNDSALSFLQKWGRWRSWRGLVDVEEMRALQRKVREALISSPEQWLASSSGSLPRMRPRSTTFPYFGFLTDSCEAAIRTTTTMDLLRRVKFRSCARPDCAVPFPIESKHERRYCTQYCAHLESVRRNRRTNTS